MFVCVVCAAFGFAGCVLTLIGSLFGSAVCSTFVSAWFCVWFCLDLFGSVWIPLVLLWFCFGSVLVLFGSAFACVCFSTFRGKKNKRCPVSLSELHSETEIDSFDFFCHSRW